MDFFLKGTQAVKENRYGFVLSEMLLWYFDGAFTEFYNLKSIAYSLVLESYAGLESIFPILNGHFF